MRTQKAQRKLKLSRESLRVLTREGLTKVAGGFITNLGCDATIKPTAPQAVPGSPGVPGCAMMNRRCVTSRAEQCCVKVLCQNLRNPTTRKSTFL